MYEERYEKPLDPYLYEIKEKLMRVREHMEDETIPPEIQIILLYDAVITTMKKLIIDRVGIKVIEDLTKQRKIYFDVLLNILRKNGFKFHDIRDLEILRVLRNKIVHEGYKSSKENVKWAYHIVKNFILQNYPEIFTQKRRIRKSFLVKRGKFSKYDSFWIKQLDNIKSLIREAIEKGLSSKLDVSKLKEVGNRKNWYGSIVISKNGIEKGGEMAHLRSLGKILLKYKILESHDNLKFRFTINNKLMLTVKLINSNVKSNIPKEMKNISYKNITVNSVPLFKTKHDNPLIAIFDDEGFFLSNEAENIYKKIRDIPHIYIARLKNGDWAYIGMSYQKGGRWKRKHYYHLGTLAYQILGTKKEDEQDHSLWIEKWFYPWNGERYIDYYAIRMKEEIVISFLPLPGASRDHLKMLEKKLISEARRLGINLLNRKV